MSLELLPVPLTDRKRIDRFIRVPWYVYRRHHPCEHWVPPLIVERREYLDPKKNPFFRHAECAFWIARSGGRDVGRIAAVDDADWLRYRGERAGYFGMFESPDDPEIAGALFDAAKRWLRGRGLASVVGPFDLSTNYSAGTLIEGFDAEPFVQMPYNPPYYDALIAGCGLAKKKDLLQWRVDAGEPLPAKVTSVAKRLAARAGVRVRRLDLRRWKAEVERLLEIYNAAWQDNWGFVPVGEEEFRHIAEGLKLLVRPEIALVAEIDGEPVATCVTVININPILKRLDGRLLPFGLFRLLWGLKVRPAAGGGRLLILGVRRGYRRRGLDSILLAELHEAWRSLGWSTGEVGWTLEDNDLVNRLIRTFGGRLAKRYRVYGADL